MFYIFLETPLCEIAIGSIDDLYYLPFLTLSGDGILTLPNYDYTSSPITLPQPLPLGIGEDVTTYTTAYVSQELIIRSINLHCRLFQPITQSTMYICIKAS